MSIEHMPESDEVDARLNDGIVEPGDQHSGIDNDEMRLIRIAEFQAECLTMDDPSQACLGAITGGLMEIAQLIEKPIVTKLCRDPTSIEAIRTN